MEGKGKTADEKWGQEECGPVQSVKGLRPKALNGARLTETNSQTTSVCGAEAGPTASEN